MLELLKEVLNELPYAIVLMKLFGNKYKPILKV